MGAHSTLCISRKAALERLKNVPWDELSNNQLGSILDSLFYHRLYNFTVSTDGKLVDEDDEAFFEGIRLRVRHDEV